MKKKHVLAYYLNMLNRNKPFFKLLVPIDCILEIYLPPKTWEKIVRIATVKNRSYSWVVRYCVFRLIKHGDPSRYVMDNAIELGSKNKSQKFILLNKRAKQQVGIDKMHRHKLCLYGNDEFFIRIFAGLMHCTMTHLVRLALEWNLDDLEQLSKKKSSRFHRLAFYWLGIKLYSGVDLPTISSPHKHIRLIHFHDGDYW